MNTQEEAYNNAIEVIAACAKETGFYASGLPGGYEALWARDSMIMTLGAATRGEQFRAPIEKSIALLAKYQSSHGQIPNCVGDYNKERKSDITFNSIDSSLWYIIGHHAHAQAYSTITLLEQYKNSLAHAFVWLSYQDPNEDTLLVQQPTMDWQDAFPHKYGRVLNTQALYYAALRFARKNKEADHLRDIVNGVTEQYLSLYDEKRGYYLPWIWKTHDTIREEEYWFDTLSNLLAIVTGLATPEITKNILSYIKENNIDVPYPCRALHPPLTPADAEWKPYFSQVESRPYHYSNAGIWPFIGGFYVAALVAAGMLDDADTMLIKLAEANKKGISQEWEFNEWLHGTEGTPQGNPYQGWSASMYLYAYACVKQKRVLLFDNR